MQKPCDVVKSIYLQARLLFCTLDNTAPLTQENRQEDVDRKPRVHLKNKKLHYYSEVIKTATYQFRRSLVI